MISYNRKLKAVIPARGGSKGVPRKNVRIVNGIPLIAYPIIAAKKCKLISQIYVSTDDLEISEISKQFGAKIINRPKELASDISLDIDVMRHAVREFKSYDDIVHLRATTPMVSPKKIDEAIKFFLSNPGCTALRSAHESPETAYKSFKKSGPYWQGLFDNEMTGDYYNLPRQSLPKTFAANGYVDIVRPTVFMESDRFHGSKMLAFITEFSHEIDTIEDLRIIEAIYG